MSYSFQRSITIDHTKCGSSDSANIPILFSGTYAYLATIANGGDVHSSAGYDIVFTSDAAGLIPLNSEVEFYDPTTGEVDIWVQLPNVSSSVDTVFYIWYGNAAVSGPPNTTYAVWYNVDGNARYIAVYHLQGSPPSFADSTASGNTLTGTVSAATGKIDGGASFNGTTNYRESNFLGSYTSGANISIEAWINSATLSSQNAMIVSQEPVNTVFSLLLEGGVLKLRGGDGTTTVSVAAPSNNTWHHVVGTIVGTTGKIYIDGALAATGTVHATGGASINPFDIGRYSGSGGGYYYSGLMDEVRISTTAYGADWIRTEYNNQSSPSTFYTIGSAVVPPAGPTPIAYDHPTIIQATVNPSGLSLFFFGVEVGDIIAVGAAKFNTPSGSLSCSDSTGNTYVGPFQSNGGGFGFVNCYYTVAQTAGNVTVTIINGGGDLANGVLIRGTGAFDQATSLVGYYTPADLSYPTGVGVGPFTLANTLVVTFSFVAGLGTTIVGVASDTGDTPITGTFNFNLFQRTSTGPGNGTVQIKTAVSAGGEMPIVVLTFSTPLARPAGTAEQYAFRGGVGFEAEDTPISELKVPLVASLPYAPVLGSLVAVGVSYTGCGPAIAALGVQDDYGNVYTQDINNTGNSTGIALFHTVLTNLPPAGEPFRAKLTTDVSGCPGVAYQVTCIAIAEKQIGALVGVTAAGWSHDIVASPNQTLVSATINNVPASTFLFGMVAWGPEFNQTDISWTPLEGYTIQQQQEFIQFFPVPGNAVRIGAGAILTKFVDSLGDYDVQVTGTVGGSFAEGGSIALLAATIAGDLAIACPTNNIAFIGVPFSAFVVGSGGIPPYSNFTIISGALPPGLTLNSATGEISGTPTTSGNYSFGIQFTDSLGVVGTNTCNMPPIGPGPSPGPGIAVKCPPTFVVPAGPGTAASAGDTTGTIVLPKFRPGTGGNRFGN